MAALFFIVLVVAWVVICLPAATRAREKGPLESTALFKRGLDLLGPDHHPEFVRTLGRLPAPTPVAGSQTAGTRPRPRPVAEVQAHMVAAHHVESETVRPIVRPVRSQQREPVTLHHARTVVLGVLVTFVLVSTVLALTKGAWELQLASDSLLAIYVSWLLEEKHRRAERRRKVRSLRASRRVRAPEPLRVAAGER